VHQVQLDDVVVRGPFVGVQAIRLPLLFVLERRCDGATAKTERPEIRHIALGRSGRGGVGDAEPVSERSVGPPGGTVFSPDCLDFFLGCRSFMAIPQLSLAL